ncbi:SDR family oxidoreductase [Stratiformator vulcanicus]|uniref:3 beta-hydroxysteroid dehydrogenase/Delta 5-->4-isomerase n=1 Tax=Stratiformator vulcanicus TaxID=2527980 RepID=A0A517R5V3_9PLAN|nr:SDR family oxidoreductase [Stratiformator vulcanicus]QDT39240.1 3 beta-hydroxysteroid dehydrogenase/Delta 5-->4-isomerase [Stratiformator vulcanicus]
MSGRHSEAPLFVTGATGYIGGRLVPRLLEAGYEVRCLVRSAAKLEQRPWVDHPQLKIIEGDVEDTDGLAEAMSGCDAAYYLIHSMISAAGEYADHDRKLAESFASAAERAGVGRIIYLGGLGELGEDLSQHLRSRREVEAALESGGVPVTSFRAAMIIGSGSASFEILRYLVERLPVMITPKWVRTETQPIAVRNVIHYLIACLDEEQTIGETLDIGGPEILPYETLMRKMAKQRGLGRRWIIPVPVLTPKLSSLWIDFVTPVNRDIARPLAEGLRNRTVCRDDRAARLMPQDLYDVDTAISAALSKTRGSNIETIWSMAGEMKGDPDWSGGTVFSENRSIDVNAPADITFRTASSIGGERGYYGGTWLWRLRGWMDQLIGGPGLRRGRRDPVEVNYGEALDFWRVGRIVPGHHLVLAAEMIVPGEAELDLKVEPTGEESSRLNLVARFRPKGLFGLLYWYSVMPLHAFVFGSLLNGIADEAEAAANKAKSDPAQIDAA